MRRPTDIDINQLWARWCAWQVLDLWQPRERYPQPTAVRRWLDTKDETVMRRAYVSCRIHLQNNVAHDGQSRARRAAALTAQDALVIGWRNKKTSSKQAESAAFHSALALANTDDETLVFKRAHRAILSHIHVLCDIPPTLADLRTDEAWRDPWLMREVWRMLRLPDFEIVCDWYNKIQQQLEETS